MPNIAILADIWYYILYGIIVPKRLPLLPEQQASRTRFALYVEMQWTNFALFHNRGTDIIKNITPHFVPIFVVVHNI